MLYKGSHPKPAFPSWRRWLLVIVIIILATSVLDTVAFNLGAGENSRWLDITSLVIFLVVMTAAFSRPRASKDFAFKVLRFLTGGMIGGMAGYFLTHLLWATVL